MLGRIGSSFDKGKDRPTTELDSSMAALQSNPTMALGVVEKKYLEAKSEREKALGMLTKTNGSERSECSASQVHHAKHTRVDTAIGSTRLESGDGLRTTSTRPSADSRQRTGSTAGELESRREVESARKQLVASTIGSTRLESGDGSRTTSTRPSADSRQRTGSTAGELESRREVESARKLLVASTKELSKQIKGDTARLGCSDVARWRVDSLLDSNNQCWEAGMEAPFMAVAKGAKWGRLGLVLYCTACRN